MTATGPLQTIVRRGRAAGPRAAPSGCATRDGGVTTVCVFCGSSQGSDPAFAAAAEQFGKGLAARGAALVYGGASVGLMGVVADAVIAGRRQGHRGHHRGAGRTRDRARHVE